MAGLWRVAFIILIFTAVTLPLLPLQMIAHRLERFWHKSLPHWWQKFMCRLLGFHVTVNGTLSRGRPLLLVSNHVSWSDILVLGSRAEVSFIAKSEVQGWPLFGTFAKLQRTIFIDRDRKHKSIDQAREIAERLHTGEILVLFAEGTTSDGLYLMGALAIHTNAVVYAADRIQWYRRYNNLANGRYDFGEWEGTLRQFPPDGGPPTVVAGPPVEFADVMAGGAP